MFAQMSFLARAHRGAGNKNATEFKDQTEHHDAVDGRYNIAPDMPLSGCIGRSCAVRGMVDRSNLITRHGSSSIEAEQADAPPANRSRGCAKVGLRRAPNQGLNPLSDSGNTGARGKMEEGGFVVRERVNEILDSSSPVTKQQHTIGESIIAQDGEYTCTRRED